MPFVSVKQRTWMRINKPAMAKRWEAEHGNRVVPRLGSYGKACRRCKYQQRGRQ